MKEISPLLLPTWNGEVICTLDIIDEKAENLSKEFKFWDYYHSYWSWLKKRGKTTRLKTLKAQLECRIEASRDNLASIPITLSFASLAISILSIIVTTASLLTNYNHYLFVAAIALVCLIFLFISLIVVYYFYYNNEKSRKRRLLYIFWLSILTDVL